MELEPLKCSSCGAPIQAEDIDWDLGIARCRHCGTVFELRNLAISDAQRAKLPRQRPPVPMPQKFSVINTEDELQISYRWFSLAYIPLLLFTVFWDGFLVVWYGIALTTGAYAMALFATLHTLVGIGLAYYVLCGVLNSTTIWVKMDTLGIVHAPLPWGGNKEIPATEIEQIYCKERLSRSNNSVSYRYDVYAKMSDGTRKKLLSGLDSAEQALYIEQTLEKYLGIKDRPVAGELPR